MGHELGLLRQLANDDIRVDKRNVQVDHFFKMMVFSVSDTGILRVSPNRSRTFDLPITISDTLPLTYHCAYVTHRHSNIPSSIQDVSHINLI